MRDFHRLAPALITAALACAYGCAARRPLANDAPADRPDDRTAEQEIRRLYDLEHELLLARDFAAQERFYPDDFVVTNPFNMFIDKPKVMERLRADIIKYSTYERHYDAFRRYGDTMVVVGSETVVPTHDANRPDAGMTVRRRFTEMWLWRDGGWQKVVRHASNIAEPLPTLGPNPSR